MHCRNYGKDGVPVKNHVLLKELEKGVWVLCGNAVYRLHQRADSNLACLIFLSANRLLCGLCALTSPSGLTLLSLIIYNVRKEMGTFTEIMLAVICALLKLRDCSNPTIERKEVFTLNFLWVNLLGLFSGLCSKNKMSSSALGIDQLHLLCLKGIIDSAHRSLVAGWFFITDSHSVQSRCLKLLLSDLFEEAEKTSKDLFSAHPLVTHRSSFLLCTFNHYLRTQS